ncbi:MAG: hypothetical protein QW607_05455 [Desulfurococcaceae archaeon]
MHTVVNSILKILDVKDMSVMTSKLRTGCNFISIYILLMLVLFLFFFSLTYQPIDEFCFTNINLAELIMRKTKIEVSELGVSGFFVSHMIEFHHRFYPHIILAFIAMITGVNLEHIVLLPLPMLLALLSIWLILKTIPNLSTTHRMIFALMFASNLSMNFFFEFYYISLAFSLLLLYTYLAFKSSFNDSIHVAVLYILLFMAMVFSYYTAAFLAIIIMFIYRLKSKRLLLVVAFAILFIVLELIIYAQTAIEIALINAARAPYSQIIFNMQEYFKNLLLTTTQPGAYTELNPYFNNPIIQVVGSLNRPLTILYVIISLLILLKSKSTIKSIKGTYTWFIFSLFIAGIFEILIYLFMNFGVLLRFTWVALVLFMAYIWPHSLNTKIRKTGTYQVLILIAATLIVCITILNFTKSYVFSLEYGADYNNFYQKAHQSSLYFILNGGNTVFTDHFTAAVITQDALSLDNRGNILILIIGEELSELDEGHYVLPLVKAFRAGWFGHIFASKFHTTLSWENILYTSGFFKIYMSK